MQCVNYMIYFCFFRWVLICTSVYYPPQALVCLFEELHCIMILEMYKIPGATFAFHEVMFPMCELGFRKIQ